VNYALTAEDLETKVTEAIEFIRQHEPPEGYMVGFSGGKDSIATESITKAAGVKYHLYYSNTLIDPPELVRFIRKHYPEVTMVFPKLTMWRGMVERGLPLIMGRWCCDELKKKPTENIPLKHRIMGIRAEESSKRAQRGKVIQHTTLKGVTVYHPIFEFTEGDIWDYIESRNLPYPSLYDEGFSRLGCVVCPFIAGKKLEIHKKRWPGLYKVLDKYLNLFWEKKKNDIIEKRCPFCERDDEGMRKGCEICGHTGKISFTFSEIYSHEDIMAWPEWLTGDEIKRRILVLKGKSSRNLFD
jgi:phosphoadenosine phosphosulfate reductase